MREWLADWLALLKQYGATLSLRTELRLLLQPLAHFSSSRRAVFAMDRASANQGPPSRLPEIVHSEIVLKGGDHADIWVDTRRVHVFDPDTGQNLTLGDSGSPVTLTTPRSGDAPAQPEADAAGQDTGSAATPPVS